MAISAGTSTDLDTYKCKFDKLKFCIPYKERFHARSNLYCRPGVCDIIKEELLPLHYKMLKESFLGWVLSQGNNMTVNFQLIHQMMLRQVKTKKKKKELWFKVDGLIARFSLAEFHVMTGLPCEDRVCKPPKAVTFSDFLGMDKCSHDDLMDCFRQMKKTSKKKLIIARLLLIEMVVCYRRIDYITEENLSLACDDETFGQYPWGKQSYEALLKALKKSATMDRKKARPSYELYGYWIAFQAWILEAFPALAEKFDCNLRMNDRDPHSLHWVCKVRHTYDEADELFGGDLTPLFPNYGEFARTPGMGYIDEEADDVCDAIGEPMFSQPPTDILYDCRHMRKYAYENKFLRNDGSEIESFMSFEYGFVGGEEDERSAEIEKRTNRKREVDEENVEGKSVDVEKGKKRKNADIGKPSKKKQKDPSTETQGKRVAVRRGRSSGPPRTNPQAGRKADIEVIKSIRRKAGRIRKKVVDFNSGEESKRDVIPYADTETTTVDADRVSKKGGADREEAIVQAEKQDQVGYTCDTSDEDKPIQYILKKRKKSMGSTGKRRMLYKSSSSNKSSSIPQAPIDACLSPVEVVNDACRVIVPFGEVQGEAQADTAKADPNDDQLDGSQGVDADTENADPNDGSQGFDDTKVDADIENALLLLNKGMDADTEDVVGDGQDVDTSGDEKLEVGANRDTGGDDKGDCGDNRKGVSDEHSKEPELDGGDKDENAKGHVVAGEADAKSNPVWVHDLIKRIEKLEELPTRVDDLVRRIEKLEELPARLNELGSRVDRAVELVAMVTDLMEKYNSLENRFTLHESIIARSQSSVNIDQPSTKMVNDVIADMKMGVILEDAIAEQEAELDSPKDCKQMKTSSCGDERDEAQKITVDVVVPESIIPVTLVEGQRTIESDSVQFVVDLGRDSDLMSMEPRGEEFKDSNDGAHEDADRGLQNTGEDVGADLPVKPSSEECKDVVTPLGGQGDGDEKADVAGTPPPTIAPPGTINLDTPEGDENADTLPLPVVTDWVAYNKHPKVVEKIEELRRSKRIPKASTFLTSPYEQQEKKERWPKHNAKKSLLSEDDHEFLYKTMRSNRDFSVVVASGRVDKSFFKPILNKDMWLECSHIEAGLYYLRKRIHEEADKYAEFVVLDWVFYQNYLPASAKAYKPDLPVSDMIGSYFLGLFPDQYGKPWASANKIYTPFNVINKHWVALEIIIDQKVINVYDCNVYGVGKGVLDAELQPIAHWLPIHLEMCGIYENFSSTPFEIRKVPDMVHDKSGSACGVFTVKAIEAVVFGGDVTTITYEKLFRYRELICSDLIKESWSFII